MKKTASVASLLILGLLLTSCTQGGTPGSPEAQNEVLATQNAMCRIENQARCAHVIENRILMSRFFAPASLGGLNEAEKERGKRITTKFIVEAAASIKQCNKVTDDSIIVLRNLRINGGSWALKATKPANENAACFLAPFEEDS